MNLCVAKEVSVRVGAKLILDNVSVSIAAGEWVSVVGPNGAGKTTLLSVMAGLRTASGRISIDDRDLKELSPRERARLLAYVPQHPEIPPGMKVSSYVLLGRTPHLSFLGMEGPDDFRLVQQVLEQFDLATLGQRTLESLSGGELQRCHLARAIAQATPIIFLDEPTTALDLGHQQQALDRIRRLREEHQVTVVMTMHDLTLAGQYSDRVILMSEGEIAADGVPSEVFDPDRLSDLYGAHVKVLNIDGHLAVIPMAEY
ncbi:MAG: ABC transporter ATP-binding protein [Acidimicrobiales bacterium]|nr:MAG: ABC transporter ATP-binding protein [Acidimicrobiales bacterium]